MGSTGIDFWQVNTYEKEKQYHINKKNYETDSYSCEVIQASKVGSNWYMAIKVTIKDVSKMHESDKVSNAIFFKDGICKDGDSYVYGHVVKTSRYKGEYIYKDMWEGVLPYYFDAPMSLIKKLSVVYDNGVYYENVKKWRDTVVQSKQAPSLKDIAENDTIKTKTQFRYMDTDIQNFQATKWNGKIVFRCLDIVGNPIIRISAKLLKDNFEFVKP